MNLINELDTLGKVESSIILYVGIVIVIILLIISYNIYNKKEEWRSITAEVISINNCETTILDEKKTGFNCLMKLKYQIDINEYINDLVITSEKNHKKLNTKSIEIDYNLDNKNIIRMKQTDNKTTGLILLIIAIVIGIIIGIKYYLSQKSTVYSATSGISTLANLTGLNKIY